ncbi:hypothetical protein ACFSPU_10070 [Haoranjiania flava]|uniref:Uncharacterized protein n=1 Tax=Haoranjiania flava TaxID=1856322 RepID=A0AAE3IKK8_9BACT|nr:hypothetical protein [Haoranjiania flava]MCU7693438.1 hypothetical protein [Haoranjiania flava]
MNKKNPKRNRFQIFTVLCGALAIVYGYTLYNAYTLGNRSKTILYSIIAICWLLLAFYWYKKAQNVEDEV